MKTGEIGFYEKSIDCGKGFLLLTYKCKGDTKTIISCKKLFYKELEGKSSIKAENGLLGRYFKTSCGDYVCINDINLATGKLKITNIPTKNGKGKMFAVCKECNVENLRKEVRKEEIMAEEV